CLRRSHSGKCRRSPADHARPPSSRLQRQGRLRRRNQRLLPRPLEEHQLFVLRRDHRHRFHFARRRRHRHHEHHAGQRHGTHPRNRRPQSAWRASHRYPSAISHRVFHHRRYRRRNWRSLRRRYRETRFHCFSAARGRAALVRHRRLARCSQRGTLLWHISRVQSVAARSCGGVALRIAMATIGKVVPQTKLLPLRGLITRERSMSFREQVSLALDTLRKNPLRSALTILGIVIGITTVIAVSSVINGLEDNVLAGIRELGTDTVIAYRFPWASLSRPPSEWFNRKELQAEWADEIAQLPHVLAASPSMRIFMPQFVPATADVRRGVNRSKNVILQGNSPSIAQVFDLKLDYGRMFPLTETERRAPVVLLGNDTVRTLSPAEPEK